MKLLLVLLVVLLGVWVWRSRRPPPKGGKPRAGAPGAPGAPGEMVRCAVCGVHLPQADAQVTARGVYCSIEHRQQIER